MRMVILGSLRLLRWGVMSILCLNWALSLSALPPAPKVVLLALADQANDAGRACFWQICESTRRIIKAEGAGKCSFYFLVDIVFVDCLLAFLVKHRF